MMKNQLAGLMKQAQSMQDNPPNSSFTFSPYTVTVDPNE